MNPKPDPYFSPEYDDQSEQQARREEQQSREALAHHVRDQWEIFRNHSTTISLREAMVSAMQTYNGQYSNMKLSEIRQFGGSEVYARMAAVKCRGATAMLRDVFLGSRRPWDIEHTPKPSIPDTVGGDIDMLVQMEASALAQAGQPIDPGMMIQRRTQLQEAAFRAALKTAKKQAEFASIYIDDLLVEGRFYDAMAQFLIDLPIFKFAVIKGPVILNKTEIAWENGKMVVTTRPKMEWRRVNPFNVYFTPGASCMEDADVIEKVRMSRADISCLLGLKGYDEQALRNVLDDYDKGLLDFQDDNDSMQADLEGRENPTLNRSGMIDMIEYHGHIQGEMLLQHGVPKEQVPDRLKDYSVDLWLIGRYVIKVQINPNPKKRHNYYGTSYEKVPGSIYGHSLIELVQDIQDVANATLRSLVNNMSIASGPQVMINEDRISTTTNSNTLYPWKRWRFRSDPMQNQSEKPIDFFQPQSNAAELLTIYKTMLDLADEVSALPRYITGSDKIGGAGRTASGLSMLMGNASKVLQNVASQIDHEVMEPLLEDVYAMIMLTDTTGILRGDESIVVKGVAVAIQKETDRMRKLEFLQITGNPVDMQILGLEGRAALLRSLSEDLGMPDTDVVPSEDQLRAKLEQQAAIAAADQRDRLGSSQDAQDIVQGEGEANSSGNPPPKPGQGRGRMAAPTDNMHRTHVAGEARGN